MSARHREHPKLNSWSSCPSPIPVNGEPILIAQAKKFGLILDSTLILTPHHLFHQHILWTLTFKSIQNPTAFSHLYYHIPNPHHHHLSFPAGLPTSFPGPVPLTACCQHGNQRILLSHQLECISSAKICSSTIFNPTRNNMDESHTYTVEWKKLQTKMYDYLHLKYKNRWISLCC